MKKRFLTKLKILALLLFVFTENYGIINGPPTIVPGVSNNYTWGGLGFFVSWSANNTLATFANPSSNPGVLSITNAIQSSNITITANYNYLDANNNLVPGSETMVISVNPFLKATLTTIYPGQSSNINCQDNCPNCANHTLCLWDWGNPAGVNCLGCGNNSLQNSVLISFPSQGTPASHNISCVQKCNGGSFQYSMPAMTINYKLQTPSISGPAGTACNGVPATLVYTASQDSYASWYIWTIPSGWTINGNANGNQISVTTNGTSVGALTAKAYMSNGSAICSNAGSFNVACCPSIVYATGWIISGSDLKTASSQVIATSVIANGATAKYHAGDAVILNPGFSSVLGSNFHAYNEPGCSETYYRTIPNNNIPNATEDLVEAEQITGINLGSSKQNQTSDQKIEIFPNPNDGKFRIVFKGDSELPGKIIIFNPIGQEIKTINPERNQIDIDLTDNQEGLYLVSIQYHNKIETRKVVKK